MKNTYDKFSNVKLLTFKKMNKADIALPHRGVRSHFCLSIFLIYYWGESGENTLGEYYKCYILYIVNIQC